MMSFNRRRLKNSLILIFVSIALNTFAMYFGTPLYRIQIWSGWILLTLILLLFLYSVRKKINLLPIGKASSWLQFHAYAGLLSSLVFLKHTSFQLPTGTFETLLAILFASTALSGIIGMIFSRIIPLHLTRRGEEVIYERIPAFSYKLKVQAQDLVLECTLQTNSTALADYYQNHLSGFFQKPYMPLFHLYGSMGYLHTLEIKHNTFCRYLNEQENQYAKQLFELIRKKYDLDFHYTLQSLLKTWLFIHVPLTYALLLAMTVHLMLIYAFLGHLQ